MNSQAIGDERLGVVQTGDHPSKQVSGPKARRADHSAKSLRSSPPRVGSTMLIFASYYLELLRSMRSLMKASVGLSFRISWTLSSPKSVTP